MICPIIYRLANYLHNQYDAVKSVFASMLNYMSMEDVQTYWETAKEFAEILSECDKRECDIKLLQKMLLSLYHLPEYVTRRDRMLIAFEILHAYNTSCETRDDLKHAARLALDCVYGGDCDKAYTEIYRTAYLLS